MGGGEGVSDIPWSGSVPSTSLTEGNGIQPTSLSDWLLQEAFAFHRPRGWSSVSLETSYKAPHPQDLVSGSHLGLGKCKMPSPQSC